MDALDKGMIHIQGETESDVTRSNQAPLSVGFFKQEYWSGLPFPPPGQLPDPEIEPTFPVLPSRFFNHCSTWKATQVTDNLILFVRRFLRNEIFNFLI